MLFPGGLAFYGWLAGRWRALFNTLCYLELYIADLKACYFAFTNKLINMKILCVGASEKNVKKNDWKCEELKILTHFQWKEFKCVRQLNSIETDTWSSYLRELQEAGQ